MRNAAGHLADNFHLLGLLERSLNLPPPRDLLPELFIRLYELARSLPHHIFQMGRRRIPVEQVLLHLILPSAGAQSRLYRADKRHSIQGPLKQRDVPEALKQAPTISLSSTGHGPRSQDDEWKVGPGGLTSYPLFQRQSSTVIKRLFSHESDRSTFPKPLMQVVEVCANYRVKVNFDEVLCGRGCIAAYRCKHKDPLFELFSSRRHCSFPA
jgi:hypothetical protein